MRRRSGKDAALWHESGGRELQFGIAPLILPPQLGAPFTESVRGVFLLLQTAAKSIHWKEPRPCSGLALPA